MEYTARKHVKTVHENIIQILNPDICKEILERGDAVDGLPQSLETALPTPSQHDTIPRRSARALTNDVTRHFEETGIDTKRARVLAKLVRSFENAQQLDKETYSHLWRDEEEFGEHDVGLRRTDRLHRLRQRFEKASAENDCAARLCLMFSVNEVVHYSLIADKTDMKLKSGRRRIVAALEKFDQDNSMSRESMRIDKLRSRNYFHLLHKNGPGSLLELATGSSSEWEVKASEAEVELALDYRKTRLPELEQRAAALNAIGARTIVRGLLAYGWTFAEVSSSPTPLQSVDETCIQRRKMHSSTSSQIRRIPEEVNKCSIGTGSAGQNDSLVDEDLMHLLDSSGSLPNWESSQDLTECPASVGQSSGEETDDQDWMQLLNTSGDLPDPLSFDSRPATVDPRFLGTEATVPDKPLRSDSHGLTTVHQSMDLFGSG